MASPIKSAQQKTQSWASVRLRKHADYQRAYAASRKRQSASMSWFLARQAKTESRDGEQPTTTLPSPSGPRVGLTVGKVIGKAHERNRIKRRMRDVLRRHVDLLPNDFDLVLHPRRVVLTLEFTKLEAEIVRILTQAQADGARMAAQSGSRAAMGPSA
jgi:ribonuclease P protein component